MLRSVGAGERVTAPGHPVVMSNHDPYSDSPSLLVGFGTTKVYSADRSRHCHGINSTQNRLKAQFNWSMAAIIVLEETVLL